MPLSCYNKPFLIRRHFLVNRNHEVFVNSADRRRKCLQKRSSLGKKFRKRFKDFPSVRTISLTSFCLTKTWLGKQKFLPPNISYFSICPSSTILVTFFLLCAQCRLQCCSLCFYTQFLQQKYWTGKINNCNKKYRQIRTSIYNSSRFFVKYPLSHSSDNIRDNDSYKHRHKQGVFIRQKW